MSKAEESLPRDAASPGAAAFGAAGADVQGVRDAAEAVRLEMAKSIVGQAEAVESLILGLFTGGHVLLEGVPGLAKTLMARALAAATGCEFRRIQFTPDLMPTDITGATVYDPQTGAFHVRRGPIFTNLVLADEINRTPPKTQAALLEAMEERQVTIEGESHPLPDPFVVLATQNPVEYEGTYPLPEAQLDRFLFKTVLTYPGEDEERDVLRTRLGRDGSEPAGSTARTVRPARSDAPAEPASPALSPQEIQACREAVATVSIGDDVMDYLVRLVRSTREHRRVYLGASPRAALMLAKAAQATAATAGRNFATPDDVKRMAKPVLRHRLLLHPEAEIEGITADDVVSDVIGQVEVPR